MNATEIRVHTVDGPRSLAPVYLLFEWPSMRLHEDGTRFIAALSAYASVTHQRNTAYALSQWHNFCLAAGVDYKFATADDLLEYKATMSSAVSALTGERLSTGTVAQRLSAVLNYYRGGSQSGWYLLPNDVIDVVSPQPSREALVVKRNKRQNAIVIDASLTKLIPKLRKDSLNIRPLAPDELRRLLVGLENTRKGKAISRSGVARDRLIAEWLVYVGLRLSEAICPSGKAGLTIHQILELTPDERLPFEHSIVRVYGKGGVWRNVAVPNWLVRKSLDYIEGERAESTKHLKKPSAKLFVAGLSCHPKNRGLPITGRAFQKAFSLACQRVGLYRIAGHKIVSPDTHRLKGRSLHSPHDLRHTYAVATYFAERELGNAEPWKPIQAQLGHRHLTTTIDTYLSLVGVHNQWGRDIWRVSVRDLIGLPNG